MGFSLDISVPALTVFLQGLFSFFSPCVLPLLPLYLSYLTGQSEKSRLRGLVNTVFFVIGVSFAFFVLGLGVSALGMFFRGNQLLFARIGGVLVILFGLYQLGVFGTSGVLSRELRLPFQLDGAAMSPAAALILGFTFSFSWTPCVGPALASVLLMAASADTKAHGFLLIGVYTLGFILPFLAVGLFTSALLGVFRKYRRGVQYTVKAGAVLMIFMGVLMITGQMNTVSGYLSELSGTENVGTEASGDVTAGPESAEPEIPDTADASGGENEGNASAGESEAAEEPEAAGGESEAASGVLPAIDFTLTDQYGNEHTLSDYKGKTVFLNFWATWCHWCVTEMDDIQMLYDEYKEAGDDSVVILGIAAPDYGSEVSQEEITAFLEENGYSYPVLMDDGGNVFTSYGVYSYPTTFMFNADGNVFGYAPSGRTKRRAMASSAMAAPWM